MATKFTPQQQAAIDTRDKTLLVSAAAGSGKTATLTQRIIASLLDEENPADISELLIVTFTNAAVGELKERIGKAIRAALAEHPENQRLQRQLLLLPSATICTIDAFCNQVLRANTGAVGIPPNYRIADAAEAELLGGAVCVPFSEIGVAGFFGVWVIAHVLSAFKGYSGVFLTPPFRTRQQRFFLLWVGFFAGFYARRGVMGVF